MGQHKVIVGEGQPQMFLHPGQVFRETEYLAGQTAITLPARQVISFDVTGVDRLAGRRSVETSLDRGFIPADNARGDFGYPSVASMFNYLCIMEVRRW